MYLLCGENGADEVVVVVEVVAELVDVVVVLGEVLVVVLVDVMGNVPSRQTLLIGFKRYQLQR